MSGNDCIKLSSAVFNFVRVRIDLILLGTTLYSAAAVDENKRNLMVLMLLYLELPSGRRHVAPSISEW